MRSSGTDEPLAEVEENLAETDDKLNALIEIVDQSIRGDGKRRRK
jgi:hypothetical protein